MPRSEPASGLQRLLCCTLTAPDADQAAQCYVDWLGYRIIERAAVSVALAQHWDAPLTAGRRCVVLAAPTGRDATLRFIEQPPAPPDSPLLAQGWNAVEILVEDPYELARSLAGSPFKVVVPPRPLPFDADIRAMQVIGPAGELLYLTALPANRVILDLHPARCRVDRPFITVLGTPQISAALDYFSRTLHTAVIAPSLVNVQIVNEQFGLPGDHRIPLGIVKLPKDYLVEVDEYPAATRPRVRPSGQLTPPIAMVSFECLSLDELKLPWRQRPSRLPDAPYLGRRAGVTVGPAGAWIELIEGRANA